jgi:hypothetical protein
MNGDREQLLCKEYATVSGFWNRWIEFMQIWNFLEVIYGP